MKAAAMPEDLVPYAAAVQIIEELEALIESKMPDPACLVEHLVCHAEEMAATNDSFRRKLCGKLGRDWLYAFMRHWLAAELKRSHPATFRRLPPRYAVGDPGTGSRPLPESVCLMKACA